MADGALEAILDGADRKPETTAPVDDSKLAQLVAWFDDAEEATDAARKASERDRDYYDGKQFTAAELKTLRDRGQPDIVINRIQPKINYLMGYEAVNRTDPRAFPRTPQDQDAAEACTDALRYIKDKSDLDQMFSTVWENLMIEGFGGVELTVEQSARGEVEIVPVRWDWDRLFYDPHSRRDDFSDARYLGGVLWMDAEDAKARWPEQAEDIERTLVESANSRTYEDRPDRWVSRSGQGSARRHRIRVVQIYYREGSAWHHCTYTRGVMFQTIEVPFRDQDGQSWCPLLLQSAYVDRENNRYGLVRLMIGVQDEINKRRAKALHRLTMRQTVGERGAVDDEDATRQEMAKPDGMVWVNPGFRFEMLNGSEQLAGELNLLQEAKNEIESMGPNAALLGKDDNAPSGKAILANQQGGQTEIALLLDRHRHLKRRTYRRIWDLVRQYKNEEWWVRVTDDEKNVKFVGFNRPVTAREQLEKRIANLPEDQQQQAQLQIEQAAQDPMFAAQLEQVVGTENVAADMYMDVTLEDVPDVANVQEEQFAQLTSLAPAVVFPPEIYIQASSLRNKRELLEKLNGQAPDPVAAEIAKIQAEQAIKKTEAEIEKLRAEALKARVDADKADAEFGLIVDPRIAQPGAEQMDQGASVPPPGLTGAEDAAAGLTGVGGQ